MKKYLFGVLAVTLAIGFSAFTTPKKVSSKALTYTFSLTSNVPSQANITSASGSSQYYGKWTLTSDNPAVVCDPGTDLVCLIQLDAKYTHDYGVGVGRRINIVPQSGSELGFTFSTADGEVVSGVQYKIVTNSTTSDIQAYNAED